MTLTFSSYRIDDNGVYLTFTAQDPGADKLSDYTVFVTDAEITGSTLAQLKTIVTNRLDRKIQAAGGLAAKLSALIGQSVTI